MLAGLVVRVGHLGQDRRPAKLGHHVHGERVGADGHVHAGIQIALEGVERHGHLGVLVRAVPHGGPALGEHAHIIAEGVVAPRMRGGEHPVPDEGAIVEEADVGQELDGRLAVLVHGPLELDEVADGVRVDRHVELARGVLALAQQPLAARLHLGGVEHSAQPALGSLVVALHEADGLLQPLAADLGVLLVGEPALGVHEGVAIAEGRAAVDAHAELVDQPGIAVVVAAQAPDVDDRGGAVLERVQEHEGAQRGGSLRGRRRHLALERRREAHVVRRAVVVLGHVEQQIIARVARRVHVRVDEPRRDELAARLDRRIGRPRVGGPRVDDLVVLEHDAALLVDLVALAVERDDPAARDVRLHALSVGEGNPSRVPFFPSSLAAIFAFSSSGVSRTMSSFWWA